MLEIKGAKIATINCGLKYKNRDDLLLMEFEKGTAVAGVFTQSTTAAAPVLWCKKILKKKTARALIVNAGNANAFTGKSGEEALLRVVEKVAELIGCKKEEVFMSSTGVIGEKLRDNLILEKLPVLQQNLNSDAGSWDKASKAIITTDTSAKSCFKETKIFGKKVKIAAFAKGSGMIAPNMATMLGYIVTDANISASALQKILSTSNETSFNAITVDSDQSTNDTVLLFATKQSPHPVVTDHLDPALNAFKKALQEVMLDLAKKIVIDGEGASKLIEVNVCGAASKKSAKIIALAIANSPLVKTAIAGEDPNWGRIVMAVGKCGEKVDQKKLEVKIGKFLLTKNGEVNPNYVEREVHQYLKNKEVQIFVDLNLVAKNKKMQHSSTVWTCDLTEGYIKINKDYRS